MQTTIIAEDLTQTEEIAQVIGKNLRGGETLELISDVGGGKTTFVKSLAKAAGSDDHVSSPTFTITNIYKTPKFDIYHFDFYRLHEGGMVAHELHENIHDKQDVVIVEWSDVVEHVLPQDRLQIFIKTKGEDKREFEFICPDSLKYLLEDVNTKH